MQNERQNLSPIEASLGELSDAGHSGVFNRTVLDLAAVQPLSSGRRTVPFFASWRHFGLPAAACLVLAMGVGAYLFDRELTIVRRTLPGAACVVEGARSKTEFNICFGGPGGGQMPECKVYDCDTDGDVDLADFASYQVAMVKFATR